MNTESVKNKLISFFLSSKKTISVLYKQESKYLFISVYYSGIIITVLFYEYGKIIDDFLPFFSYIALAYIGIKITEYISYLYSGNRNTLKILVTSYLVFLSYLVVLFSEPVSSFVASNLKVQPEIFQKTIFYISTMEAIQYTLSMLKLPLMFSIFASAIIVMVSKLENWKVVSKFIIKIFIISAVIGFIFANFEIKNGKILKKPYDYWFYKHGFVDAVLCEGDNYKNNIVYLPFRAKKITNTEYLISDYTTYNKKIIYNYNKITCEQIESYKLKFNSIVKMAYQTKDRWASRLNQVIKIE